MVVGQENVGKTTLITKLGEEWAPVKVDGIYGGNAATESAREDFRKRTREFTVCIFFLSLFVPSVLPKLIYLNLF